MREAVQMQMGVRIYVHCWESPVICIVGDSPACAPSALTVPSNTPNTRPKAGSITHLHTVVMHSLQQIVIVERLGVNEDVVNIDNDEFVKVHRLKNGWCIG